MRCEEEEEAKVDADNPLAGMFCRLTPAEFSSIRPNQTSISRPRWSLQDNVSIVEYKKVDMIRKT